MIDLEGDLLIIACGNPYRRDDGAGLLLGKRLADECRERGISVRLQQVHQLLPELAVEIANQRVALICFVDCRVARRSTDREVIMERVYPVDATPASTHHVTPALLLLYAHSLFEQRPPAERPPAWQISVPGFEFGHGDEISGPCRLVLDTAVEPLLARLREVSYA